ncbi:unnamed protein product [Fusarium graminearum]|uniref:Uncharacterized protein n=2 Tax=Fusarium sambucinum species complex TaxID=569360 RepID=A0A2H3FT42_GIBZA|nr:hypothetical protein FAUST_9754 [Fusarium austroamericanum]KAI6748695.1 hypothetical protein HG531_007642 [Fusarium graminearum]PCD18688.1 hypothetical protein FGRA07_06441 [Fusarium graminearum]CAF3559977.1 unnamed protein product [Fusarium graminearum]CAF3612981.1 unnamed protein product [Fusarium graminearum]
MEDSPVKTEGASRHRAGYKSWKKKYRKMRIVFDQKMHDGEELHKQEDKAAALVKRLAVENEYAISKVQLRNFEGDANNDTNSRLLDLLLDINNSPQIPPEKQVEVSLQPSSDSKAPVLPLDEEYELRKDTPRKRLEDLVSSVPHSTYSTAKESLPQIVSELKAPEGEAFPADFLSADDIDNYIYDIDMALDNGSQHLPTLAPRAHPGNHQQSHPHLKNPTSVTNWLRKHAPKIFLQDGEAHGDADDNEGGHTGGRKTRGSRGERGGRASTRGKRVSAAARAVAADRDVDVSMDEEPDVASTPISRGKRKRNNEDDTGYKPRGSSTRPTKKKRKSEAEGTPSARKPKKEKEASAAQAD